MKAENKDAQKYTFEIYNGRVKVKIDGYVATWLSILKLLDENL